MRKVKTRFSIRGIFSISRRHRSSLPRYLSFSCQRFSCLINLFQCWYNLFAKKSLFRCQHQYLVYVWLYFPKLIYNLFRWQTSPWMLSKFTNRWKREIKMENNIFSANQKSLKRTKLIQGLSSDCRLQQWQYLSPGAQRQFKRKINVILSWLFSWMVKKCFNCCRLL